jgi:adenylate cyclase
MTGWRARLANWGRGKRSKTALVVAVAAGVIAAVTLLRLIDPRFLVEMREHTFDAYQQIHPRPYGDYPVRIVDIDDASLAVLGQWPWPRTRLAALVNRLNELGAAVVAFDAVFAEPDRATPERIANELHGAADADLRPFRDLLSRLPDYDQVFATAIEPARVVGGFTPLPAKNDRRPPRKAGIASQGLAASKIIRPRFQGATTNLPIIDRALKGVGGIIISVDDRTGIVRRVPMLYSDGVEVYPGLVAEALRVAQTGGSIITRSTSASGELDSGRAALVGMRIGTLPLPLTPNGELWLYYDRDRPERYVSVKDVLDPSRDAEIRPRIEAQIVFVGTSARGLLDSRMTTLGAYVPGVSIHAQMAEQIVSQTFLNRPDWADGAELTATILLGVLLTFILLALGSGVALAVGAAAISLGVAGSWHAFSSYGVLLDPIYPSLGALAVTFAVTGVLYVTTDRERRFVREVFGQYHAPELLAKLERAPHLMRLGGEIRPLSIMFMDVRGFTSISEQLSAEELVHFLNKLLSPLSDAIEGELGFIDKYVGDAIMAFWNAPLDIPDHAARACRAALRMRSAITVLNAADAFGFKAGGHAQPEVHIRIGINTGEACVGNMGSETRFNYSALGDAVNVASRVESSAKNFGVDILVAQDTARAASDFAFLEAGEQSLKGKSHATLLFALVGGPEVAAGESFRQLAAAHARLIAALPAGDGAAAAEALRSCRALATPELSTFYDRFEARVCSLTTGPASEAAE